MRTSEGHIVISVEDQRNLVALRKEGDQEKLKNFYAELGYRAFKYLETQRPEMRFRIHRDADYISAPHWYLMDTMVDVMRSTPASESSST